MHSCQGFDCFSQLPEELDPIVFDSAPQVGLKNKIGRTCSVKLEELRWIPRRMEPLDLGLRMMFLHKGITSHNNYIAVFL